MMIVVPIVVLAFGLHYHSLGLLLIGFYLFFK